MKIILTAALAASLLGGTAAMAQPGDRNRDHGKSSEQIDRKDPKAEDKKTNQDTPPNNAAPKAPERAADARPQGPVDRNPNAMRFNRPAPTQPVIAAPERAADARQQADRNQASGRFNRSVPAAPPPREAYSGRGQADRMPVQQPQFQTRNPAVTNNVAAPSRANRWARGDRVPDQYRQNQYYVNDWQQHGLRQPPGGYRWVRDDNNDFFLSLMATGIIADTVYRSDRDDRWRQRYSRSYDYNDDVYYQQCRRSPDPAGILAGGLIGGLLGNAASHGRTGPTIAGVIFGGAVGATLTSSMNCEDRSYAYRTYYNGFNSGHSGGRYEWRNPRNNHRGEFRIRSYYNDPYGFRCARFTQVTYIQNRSFNVRGIACRQPDGSWAVVN